MGAIFKREFKSYMHNITGPLFICFLLLFTGGCTLIFNMILGLASFQETIGFTAFAFVVVIPLIAMHSFTEDRALHTDKLLYSLPLKSHEIVLGKFFAIVAVFAIPVAVMTIYPIIISAYGHMYYYTCYSALLALFLLGLALISICMFISSFTESQVVSAIVSVATLIFLAVLPYILELIPSTPIVSFFCLILVSALIAVLIWALTKNSVISVSAAAVLIIPACIVFFIKKELFEGLFFNIMSRISLYSQFNSLNSGLFDIKSVVYLLSVTAFFLFLCVQSLEKRRLN